MISPGIAKRFIGKRVSISCDGSHFFRGVVTKVTQAELLLDFSGVEQVYELDKIILIQGVPDVAK